FSGCAQYRWRPRRYHSARERTRVAGALQRCAFLLANGSEAISARSTGTAQAVTFQKDLGSYYDKTIRTQRLAGWLSETLKQGGITLRPGVIHKAACLAKTDLTTELVKEFTELQGIVGGLYARVQVLDEGLSEDARQCISTAIYDHYKPESMDDS